MIATAFPLTLQLTFLGVLIAVVMSLVFGVLGALYRDKWHDQLVRVFSIAAVATPSFWLGILLIQWFALGDNPLFPSGGTRRPAGVGLRRLAALHGAARPGPGHPGLRLADPRGPHLHGGGTGPRLRPHRDRQRRPLPRSGLQATCSATPWSPR